MRWKNKKAGVDFGGRSRPIALALVGALVVSCSPISVSLDYDPRIDFRTYRTFDWLGNRPGTPDEVEAALTEDRAFGESVREAVESELRTKGLSQDVAGPDVLLMWHLGKNERIDVRRFGYAYSAQYGAWAHAMDSRYYREGTLVVDVIDARTMRLVWRGVASSARDEKAPPEEAKARVRETVRKLFSRYPPS